MNSRNREFKKRRNQRQGAKAPRRQGGRKSSGFAYGEEYNNVFVVGFRYAFQI